MLVEHDRRVDVTDGEWKVIPEQAANVNWREIAISNNVGGVKDDVRTRLHALVEERHFALVDGLRFPTWARF
jgi:hypothetical protein